jgi:hypothetical protein
MAEKMKRMPERDRRRPKMDPIAAARLARRRIALDALRKQSHIAEQRIRFDMFNTWRTGHGTMKEIGDACGYSVYWVSNIINRIRNNEELLQEAIDEWMKDNPGEELE